MSLRVQVPDSASGRATFTYSPVLEAILSISILLQPDHHPLHHEWVRETRKRLPSRMKQGLADFRFSHFGFIPAELVPPAGVDPPDFDSEMARIRALPTVEKSLPILRNLVPASDSEWDSLDDPATAERILERSSNFGSRVVEMVRLGLEAPDELADTFLQFLTWYWELIFEPEWQQVEGKLAETVADARSIRGEVYPMLDALRPRIGVNRDAGELRIRSQETRELELSSDAEIVFVPSAFLWPHVGVACDSPDRLALVYPAPFAAYAATPVAPTDELVTLLQALADPTRLQALRLIAEHPRSTQELARLIGISKSATSNHLRKLADCHVLETRRDGYYQLYSLNREQVESVPSMLRNFLDAS